MGIGFRAELEIAGNRTGEGAELFERPKRRAAIVRISRAVGLPEPALDALGLALRVRDAYGPGADQDLLLVTSGFPPLARQLPLPGLRGYRGGPYSSVFPYRVGSRIGLIGALPDRLRPEVRTFDELRASAAAGELCFTLALAGFTGSWRPLAKLALGAELPPAETEDLRFNPWNTGGGIRPLGPLMGLRKPAYLGSQRGRLATAR